MLITFKSHACGDVAMFESNGKDMLRLLGKNPSEVRGIVTVDQMPAAIGALEAAIAADRATGTTGDEGDSQDGGRESVRLFQRAAPLLEMLRLSLKNDVPVTWGV